MTDPETIIKVAEDVRNGLVTSIVKIHLNKDFPYKDYEVKLLLRLMPLVGEVDKCCYHLLPFSSTHNKDRSVTVKLPPLCFVSIGKQNQTWAQINGVKYISKIYLWMSQDLKTLSVRHNKIVYTIFLKDAKDSELELKLEKIDGVEVITSCNFGEVIILENESIECKHSK